MLTARRQRGLNPAYGTRRPLLLLDGDILAGVIDDVHRFVVAARDEPRKSDALLAGSSVAEKEPGGDALARSILFGGRIKQDSRLQPVGTWRTPGNRSLIDLTRTDPAIANGEGITARSISVLHPDTHR